ncbi:MAG: ketol-acid reductoisomerase [Dehalococcoidia bacterium]|nr:ketol-acid reductoisomerase [Dehalococcoidia bacterium]
MSWPRLQEASTQGGNPLDSPATPRFYRQADADPTALDGCTVAVLGYGNLGRSVALNLRDSGVSVVVGNRDDEYAAAATADGFRVEAVAEATAAGDVAFALLPDEVLPEAFAEIGPRLRSGGMLALASGYNLAYGLIDPPAACDVCLLAPRMVGSQVRELFQAGGGYFAYVNVEHDASGKAWPRLLALASAIGALRHGAFQLSARDEAALDLFIEQAVGTQIGSAFQLAFQVGVEAGIPPEALVLEMYMSGEMARSVQAFAEQGFYRSVVDHGRTAQFGGFIRTIEMDRPAAEDRTRRIFDEIVSGDFARRFQAEKEAGYPTIRIIDGVLSGNDPQSQAEDRVRALLDQPGAEQ